MAEKSASPWPHGHELRKARESLGLSAREVSLMTGGAVSRQVITNLEGGRRSDISVGELLSLASALGVAITDIDRRLSEIVVYESGRQEGIRQAVIAVDALQRLSDG